MLSRSPISHPQVPASRRGFSATLLKVTRNPSKLVRGLYLNPDLAPHAFLSGYTAEIELGKNKLGTETVDPSYFYTDARWKEHMKGLEQQETCSSSESLDLPLGTVGAVALDKNGCIAVVTSTGGKTNKLVGRIGDTPSMGSGFWAEEWTAEDGFWNKCQKALFSRTRAQKLRAVGVSGTGDGDVRAFVFLDTYTEQISSILFDKQLLLHLLHV